MFARTQFIIIWKHKQYQPNKIEIFSSVIASTRQTETTDKLMYFPLPAVGGTILSGHGRGCWAEQVAGIWRWLRPMPALPAHIAACGVITAPAGMGSLAKQPLPAPIFPSSQQSFKIPGTLLFSPCIVVPAPSPCLTTQQQSSLQPFWKTHVRFFTV